MLDEIPPSRINIHLDLNRHGATERHELPLKLLCLGPFTLEQKPLKQRNRVQVQANTFNQTMASLKPSVKIEATADTLTFSNLSDFEPQSLARNIPKCQALIAKRSLLKELRSLAIDNPKFQQCLIHLLRNPETYKKITQQLQQQSPIERG